ncbi:MAG: hypothetical protein IIA65_05665 [Planctomycetes bacterium]|nr:hypothetical protein [Planctomycetota bacterium]
MREAEDAGWIPVRYELLTGTYHYMAIFAQKDLFPLIPKEGKKKSKATGPKEGTDAGHTIGSIETLSVSCLLLT